MPSRMKCRKCGQPAAINMRRHKLALCEICYPEWFQTQVEKTIRKFQMFDREDRILVAVSGGKDSLTLWDVLLRLGYRADGLYIQLGIGHNDYSIESQRRVAAFAESRGANYRAVSVEETYGLTIPELARQRRRLGKVCSICGLVKRHIMNQWAYEGGYGAIATGHNLDDEAAVLMQNALHWEAGYLARQSPVLPSVHPRLAQKVKPLCLTYERESAAYALVRGIDYIYDECPHAVGAKTILYKELLNQLERTSPGVKAQFYRQFLRAKESRAALFADVTVDELHDCESCGQPTTAPGLCAFCRLWQTGEMADETQGEGE
jgi:uncharacterized protein (TIGR00269 family)